MRTAPIALLLILVAAPAALAQTGKRVAIGGAIGLTRYADDDFGFGSKDPSFSLAYRVRMNPAARSGWAWAPKSSFGLTKRDASSDIGGTRTHLGQLQTIQVMGGVQRVMHQGPWQVGLGVAAGPSINDFSVDAGARDAYQSRLGTDLGDVNVKNSIAVKPEFSAWYDLSRMLGVQGSLSYLFNRPKVETTSGGVTTTSTWKTDRASAKLGLVVGIF